jgi:hypothetical protein
MSKFIFHECGTTGEALPIYDIAYDDPRGGRKHIGMVNNTRRQGWQVWVPGNGTPDSGYRTRKAAAERALLVMGVNPAAWAALPADPFEGVSA